MFDNTKKRLFYSKVQILLKKGVEEGNIVSFNDEFYEKLSHTYIGCLPVSMHIKYLKPKYGPGECYDRSLYMFFCFQNAVLVRGDNKYLELEFGKDNAGHGWIEIDDYCYDPSLLLKFKKETYYEIYKPYNVSKITLDEYKNCCEFNKQVYEEITNTKLSDFQPNGKKRTDLCIMIPLFQETADMNPDSEFKEKLNDYLKLVQYDKKQAHEEIISNFQNHLR